MPKGADKTSAFKVEVKPDRVVSDRTHEVTVKCTYKHKKGDGISDNIPFSLYSKKLKINEEKSAAKGSVIFKFTPTRPTGKTQLTVSSSLGSESFSITVIPTTAQYIRDMFLSIFWAVIIAFGIIRPFILQTYYIPSASMEPTLYENDRVIGLMFPFRFRDPKPGEIIIFQRKGEYTNHVLPIPFTKVQFKTKTNFIKRVIAVGGDTVEINNHTLYVNHKPKDEPFIKELIMTDFAPYKVPKNSFFMMGDNRNNSLDSRFWGALPRKYIVSKAWVQFWPLDRVKSLIKPYSK